MWEFSLVGVGLWAQRGASAGADCLLEGSWSLGEPIRWLPYPLPLGGVKKYGVESKGSRPDSGRYPAATIDDHHLRGREALQQCGPGRLGLPIAPLPAQHVLAGERDQQAPALQVGAVEHDRRQDLAGDRRLGYLDVPAPRRRCTKRASRPPEAALGRRVQQPPDETVELGTPGNVYAAAYRRRAACFASPSRAPRAGGAVLDQLGATYTAPGVIPRNLHRTCSQSMFNPASRLAVAHEISHSIHTFLPITPHCFLGAVAHA